MGKIFFSAIVFLISAAVFPGLVSAQENGLSSGEMASPIDPHFNSPIFVGAIVGFGPSNQTGEFKTDKCDCPAFTEGTGINIVFGGLFVCGNFCHRFVCESARHTHQTTADL